MVFSIDKVVFGGVYMLFHQLRLLFILFISGFGVSCASQKLETAHLSQPKDISLRWPAAFNSDIYANQSIDECPDLGGEYECQGASVSSLVTEGIDGSHKLYYFDVFGGEILNIIADGKAHSIGIQPGVQKAHWYLAYCKDKELIHLKSYLPSIFQNIDAQSVSTIHRWKRTEDKKLHYDTLSITTSKDDNQNPFNFNKGSCTFKRYP